MVEEVSRLISSENHFLTISWTNCLPLVDVAVVYITYMYITLKNPDWSIDWLPTWDAVRLASDGHGLVDNWNEVSDEKNIGRHGEAATVNDEVLE